MTGNKLLNHRIWKKFGKIIYVLLAFILLEAILVGLILMSDNTVAVLEPKGIIANEQRNLIVFATILSMFVILPVYMLTIFIVWRYRASNSKATYKPNWDSNKLLELVWWGIPISIIFLLSVITWRTTHSLDPFKPLASSKEPMTIQVVALQWKWLFIYPEQGIATVNYVQFPEDTPITFEISADAPMNSFWIPELGGQIYAMNGMVTKLHLSADEIGNYRGSSANISGEGFADMNFIARASSLSEFEDWVSSPRDTKNTLDYSSYQLLALPSRGNLPEFYTLAEPNLHETIVMKYMTPEADYNHESMEH